MSGNQVNNEFIHCYRSLVKAHANSSSDRLQRDGKMQKPRLHKHKLCYECYLALPKLRRV